MVAFLRDLEAGKILKLETAHSLFSQVTLPVTAKPIMSTITNLRVPGLLSVDVVVEATVVVVDPCPPPVFPDPPRI